jgi:hypothetical protein
MITKQQRNKIKKEIIAELTDEKFGIFNKKGGWARYNGTDLDMVMDSVQRALTRMVDNKP